MFAMKKIPARFSTEQAYQALELLKQMHIRCNMPSDDMFFYSPFHLPRPDRRWHICVRKRDYRRAMALLEREGLINGATRADRAEWGAVDVTSAAPEAASRRTPLDTVRSGCRCSACAAPAARPANAP